MISRKMTSALNKQINAELYSAYLYMSMSSFARSKGWDGAANWFFVQTQEELVHVRKFYDYVNSQAQHVVLDAIAKPESEFASMKAIFEAGLAHERKVTGLINALVDLAREERDHATEIFLQWFVTEQVEEEQNATDIIGKLGLVGDAGPGLFMIDRELGARVFTPPAPAAE